MANKKRLIDANEAIKIVKHEADVCNSGFTRNILEFVAVKIENIPTVEVVHGRWLTTIDVDYEGEVVYHHAHMKCGFEYESYYGDGYNCCPNCGAKMDGGNEDG